MGWLSPEIDQVRGGLLQSWQSSRNIFLITKAHKMKEGMDGWMEINCAGAFSYLEVIYLIPLPHPHPMTQHKGAPLLPCPAQVQAGHNRGQISPDKPQPVLRRRGLGGGGGYWRSQEVSWPTFSPALCLLSYYTPHCSLRSIPSTPGAHTPVSFSHLGVLSAGSRLQARVVCAGKALGPGGHARGTRRSTTGRREGLAPLPPPQLPSGAQTSGLSFSAVVGDHSF